MQSKRTTYKQNWKLDQMTSDCLLRQILDVPGKMKDRHQQTWEEMELQFRTEFFYLILEWILSK
jgi:hypothetical protein